MTIKSLQIGNTLIEVVETTTTSLPSPAPTPVASTTSQRGCL